MKKKFSLEINTPCSENFANMIPNTNGSFCNLCAKNVIDLSTKTNSEVAHFIAKNINNTSICARIKKSQLEEEFEINEISKIQNFKYAAAIAATVLLTSPILSQEKNTPKTEIGCAKPNPEIMGKIAYNQNNNKIISLTIKGKVLEKRTNKPLSNNKYPNLYISIAGINNVAIDAKTGAFLSPITIDKNTKEIYVTVYNNDYSYSKNIAIDLTKIKNNSLNLNIIINSETEMQNYKIMGGLGVNYINDNKLKNV